MSEGKEIIKKLISGANPSLDYLRKEFRNFNHSQIEKKGKRDLVSYVDRTVEKKIVDLCQAILPKADILAEESGLHKKASEYLWVIDPLDGTTNFMHGIARYGISIGLLKEGKPFLGIVFDVEAGNSYWAVQGEGAFMNEVPISVSKTFELSEGLIGTGFPHPSFDLPNCYFSKLEKLIRETHGIRRFGAASLDLADVACGNLDGFFEYGLKPWDIAAGILLVKEAGGQFGGIHKIDNIVFEDELVASNSIIFDQLRLFLEQKS